MKPPGSSESGDRKGEVYPPAEAALDGELIPWVVCGVYIPVLLNYFDSANIMILWHGVID